MRTVGWLGSRLALKKLDQSTGVVDICVANGNAEFGVRASPTTWAHQYKHLIFELLIQVADDIGQFPSDGSDGQLVIGLRPHVNQIADIGYSAGGHHAVNGEHFALLGDV